MALSEKRASLDSAALAHNCGTLRAHRPQSAKTLMGPCHLAANADVVEDGAAAVEKSGDVELLFLEGTQNGMLELLNGTHLLAME